jgi:hypothetical protein
VHCCISPASHCDKDREEADYKTQEPQKQKYLNVGPTTQVVRCKYKDSREKDAVVKWMNDYRLSVCHKCNHLAEGIQTQYATIHGLPPKRG